MTCRHTLPSFIAVATIAAFLLLACGRNGAEGTRTATDSLKEELESTDHSQEQQDSIARRGMRMSADSTDYYYFLSYCASAALLRSDSIHTDSIQRMLRRYCRWQPPTQRLNDLLVRYHSVEGVEYALKHQDGRAFNALQTALKEQRGASRRKNEANILINLADIYMSKSDYANASSCLRRALFLSDSIGGMTDARIRAVSGLALLNVGLRNFTEAEKYLKMGDGMVNAMHGRQKIFFYTTKGNYYYYKEDYPNTLRQFRFIADNLKDMEVSPFDIHLTYINLADAYIKNGNADSAIVYQDKCRRFFKDNGIDVALYYLYTQDIAIALMKNDITEVKQLLRNPNAPKTEECEQLYMRYRYLLDYYRRIGDTRSALHYSECITHINDSVRNERTRLATAETEMRYKQDKKTLRLQLDLTTSNAKLRISRMILVISLLLLLLLAVSMIIIIMYAKARRKNILEQEKQHIQKLRMEELRNRVSPHFIFNVLNYELYNKQHGNETNDIPVLVNLIRKGLEQSEEVFTTLSDELDFVDGYVQLQSKGLGENFIFDERIDEQVDLDNVRLPSMMIQIAVENAIKHGLRGIERDKTLTIVISHTHESTVITVTDNGRGINTHDDDISMGTGTGMKVITGTLEMLNSRNANKIRYTMESNPNGPGCRVTITLPDNYKYTI